MANASKNHLGAASRGKRDGSGAMTDLSKGIRNRPGFSGGWLVWGQAAKAWTSA
jgi:hypothetical protein